MPMDCGYSGACHGWPKPCTASTPKTSGMCRREFLMAYFWIMLYSLAQSRPVFPTPPLPVVSMGLLVPPARTEPVLASMRILCMQSGLGRLNPLSPHRVPSVSVRVDTSCWSICPTFSASVISFIKALTRADTGLLVSSQGGVGDFAAAPYQANDGSAMPTSPTAVVTATTALRRRVRGGGRDTDMFDLPESKQAGDMSGADSRPRGLSTRQVDGETVAPEGFPSARTAALMVVCPPAHGVTNS